MRKPLVRTRSASRRPASSRWCASGSRSHSMARAYTVCASERSVPPGSRRHERRRRGPPRRGRGTSRRRRRARAAGRPRRRSTPSGPSVRWLPRPGRPWRGPAPPVGGRVQPVAVLEPAAPQPVRPRPARRSCQPTRACSAAGARRMLQVAGALVERPRNDRRGVTPGGGRREAKRVAVDVGHDVRDRAVRQLLGAQVRKPRAQEDPPCRRGMPRWARRPGCRRSTRAARRAAGSRSAGRRSCRACSRPRSRGTDRAVRCDEENQPVRRKV